MLNSRRSFFFRSLPRSLVGLLAALWAFSCTGGDGNRPPEFAVIHQQVFVVGGLNNRVIITATDKDGDPLSYSMHGKLWVETDEEEGFLWKKAQDRLPAGMSFSAAPDKAIFSWDPLASQVGVHEFTFVVSDGQATDEEKVTVEVRASEEGGGGAPEFITPSSYVLQLVHTDKIEATIAVRDEDSARVTISLDGAPEGMQLESLTADGKRAELSWAPSQAQIDSQAIWSFLAKAIDEEGNSASQQIRIVLRLKDGGGPRPDCPGDPPRIEHVPLRDQYGRKDYQVRAMVTDDSTIVRVFAAHTTENPQDLHGFIAVELEPAEEPEGSYNYQGAIPNTTEPGGDDLTFYYYLCAVDDDDAQGEECDHFWCVPEEAIFTFVAHAQEEGGGGCADDAREPNDDSAAAALLEAGVVPDLWLCPGDSDWFSVEAGGGATLRASILFATSQGDLALELFDPAGTSLARSATGSDMETVDAVLPLDGLFLLQVTGAFSAGSEGNGYSLTVELRGGGGDCPDLASEPNDSEEDARWLEAEVQAAICHSGEQDDRDVYRIYLPAFNGLRIRTSFSTAEGDLDMYLSDGQGHLLGAARSTTDNELIEFPGLFYDGTVYLTIYGYEHAQNNYVLSATRVPLQEACFPDLGEPNDDASQTAFIRLGEDRSARQPGLSSCGDEDWYAVELSEGVALLGAISFDHERGNLDLRLLAGEELLDASESDTGEETVGHEDLQSGRYLLQVLSRDGQPNLYDLEVLVE